MNEQYWLVSCGHDECTPAPRLEYCQQEAREALDDVDTITGVIETVIDYVETVSIDYGYRGAKEGTELRREFRYELTPELWVAEPNSVKVETRVSIETRKNPSVTIYTIASEWCIGHDDYLSQPMTRLYTIERYPGGTTHCTVTELDFRSDMSSPVQFIDRPMVGYDFHEAERQLEQLLELQEAEETLR